jgi:hypothetical protein
MAKVNEKQIEDVQLIDQLEPLLLSSDETTVTVGVQRLCNIGRYENIAVFSAIKLPVGIDYEALTADIESAIQYGFHITASETLKRYNRISIYGNDNPNITTAESEE